MALDKMITESRNVFTMSRGLVQVMKSVKVGKKLTQEIIKSSSKKAQKLSSKNFA